MIAKVRSSLLLAAVAIYVCAAHAQTVAPAKVAIINIQKAVADTQELKKVEAALEAKYKPRQQEIGALQDQLQSIQRQLSPGSLPPDKESQLRQDGTIKQKQIQRLTEDFQADLNNERQDILAKTGRQMADVVKKIAEDRGLDVIVDVSSTLYFRPTLDLTTEATAAYDKAYPPK
jgi:outer membrane protein